MVVVVMSMVMSDVREGGERKKEKSRMDASGRTREFVVLQSNQTSRWYRRVKC